MELEGKKRQAEGMLTNMDLSVRDRYEQLRHENEELGAELAEQQEELRQLTQKKSDMEDVRCPPDQSKNPWRRKQGLQEVTVSTIKQEASKAS